MNSKEYAKIVKTRRKEEKKKWKEQKKKGIGDFPLVMNIEPTNACNLKCPMCARTTSMTRKVVHMDFGLYKNIVDECAKYGLRAVWLHMFGESLLHPQIIDLIRYIKQYDNIKNVGLSTNVSFLNLEISEGIIDAKLDRIIFSVDAKSKASYDKARGGDFETVKGNVRNFLELKKKRHSDIEILIQMIDMDFNHGEVEEFRAEWSKYLNEGDSVLVKRFSNHAAQVPDFKTYKNSDKHQMEVLVPCSKIMKSMTIMSNGVAVACCYDANGVMEVGDTNKETLTSIWKGSKLNELRRQHNALDFSALPLCAKCSFIRVKKEPKHKAKTESEHVESVHFD